MAMTDTLIDNLKKPCTEGARQFQGTDIHPDWFLNPLVEFSRRRADGDALGMLENLFETLQVLDNVPANAGMPYSTILSAYCPVRGSEAAREVANSALVQAAVRRAHAQRRPSEAPATQAQIVALRESGMSLAAIGRMTYLANHTVKVRLRQAGREDLLLDEARFDKRSQARHQALLDSPEYKLAVRLKASGWTQRAIADHIGVSRNTMVKWLQFDKKELAA